MTTQAPDNNFFGQALDQLQTGVVVLDAQGRIRLWNGWMARHAGIARAAAESRTLLELFPELSGGRLAAAIEQACRHRLASVLSPALHRAPLPLFEQPQHRALNLRLQQLIHIVPLLGPDGAVGTLLQISDMTATVNREKLLRQQAEELQRTNYLDPLTGIGNRRRFDETLAEEFRRAQRNSTPLAVALVDIDHFKLYNDYYGHVQGDRCLVRVASGLQACLKRASDLVARYGGEEFGIALPGLDAAHAALLVDDLRLRIAALGIRHEDSPVAPHVTVSIGLAVMTPEIGADHSALVSAADIALYQAKHEGRNRAIQFSITDGSFHACG